MRAPIWECKHESQNCMTTKRPARASAWICSCERLPHLRQQQLMTKGDDFHFRSARLRNR